MESPDRRAQSVETMHHLYQKKHVSQTILDNMFASLVQIDTYIHYGDSLRIPVLNIVHTIAQDLNVASLSAGQETLPIQGHLSM